MSVNDTDGEPYSRLTREECIALLVKTGWARVAAEEEWEILPKRDNLVDIRDLEW